MIERMIIAMARLSYDDIARRLRAIRDELGKSPAELAEAIGGGRAAYYTWEKGSAAAKPNYPAEEAMVALCEHLPGLTLDYIYRGRIGTMHAPLAIRLVAREHGLNPDTPAGRAAASRAWAATLAEQAS